MLVTLVGDRLSLVVNVLTMWSVPLSVWAGLCPLLVTADTSFRSIAPCRLG